MHQFTWTCSIYHRPVQAAPVGACLLHSTVILPPTGFRAGNSGWLWCSSLCAQPTQQPNNTNTNLQSTSYIL